MAKKPSKTAEKSVIDLQAETLVGDIRDNVIGILKDHGIWKVLKEQQQSQIAIAAANIAENVVQKTASIIAGRGFAAIHAKLTQITVKGDLKLVLEAAKGVQGQDDLIKHEGSGVTVVLKDINQFLGQRSEPDIDADEPSLPMEEDEED